MCSPMPDVSEETWAEVNAIAADPMEGLEQFAEDMPKRERVNTAIRFPTELHERLLAAADERGMSLNALVVKLLRESMDRLIPADEFTLTRPPS